VQKSLLGQRRQHGMAEGRPVARRDGERRRIFRGELGGRAIRRTPCAAVVTFNKHGAWRAGHAKGGARRAGAGARGPGAPCFDRREQEGRIRAAETFGGHKSIRRPWRTSGGPHRPRIDSEPGKNHAIHQGNRVTLESPPVASSSSRDGRPDLRGRVRLRPARERGRSKVFKVKGGFVARDGRDRPARFSITSNSWEVTRRRPTRSPTSGRRAPGHGIRPVPSTGIWIWPPSVRGLLGDGRGQWARMEGRGDPAQQRDGERFMFQGIPENYKGARTPTNEAEGLALHRRGDKKRGAAARAAVTRDHVRPVDSSGGVREGPRAAPARLGAFSSTIAWIKDQEALPGNRGRAPQGRKLPEL